MYPIKSKADAIITGVLLGIAIIILLSVLKVI